MIIIVGKRTARTLMLMILVLGLVAGATSYTVTGAGGDYTMEEWLRSGQIVKQVNTSDKVLALTFDDGPSSTFTPQILDILAKHKAKATFFVVGKRAAAYPQIIKRISDEGHEIANHTYNHPLTPVKADILAQELDDTNEVLFNITGKDTRYFRPPGGKCTRATIEPALARGYRIILWTAAEDPKDWSDPGTENIISRVVENVRNGSIIILHDCGGDRTQTVDALPTILKEIQSQGYKFVTISQLLQHGTAVPAIEEFKLENWVE